MSVCTVISSNINNLNISSYNLRYLSDFSYYVTKTINILKMNIIHIPLKSLGF